MPVYTVTTASGKRRVKASTKSVAINHVIRDTITAEAMTSDEVADAVAAGEKIEVATETAKAEPAAAA